MQRFTVGGPHQAPLIRSGATQDPLELKTCYDIRIYAVPISVLVAGRIEIGGAAAKNQGTDFYGGFFDCFKVMVCLYDHRNKDVGIKRFEEIIQRPYFHGLYSSLYRGVSSHHDNAEVRKILFRLFKELHTVHSRHYDIGKHQLVCLF